VVVVQLLLEDRGDRAIGGRGQPQEVVGEDVVADAVAAVLLAGGHSGSVGVAVEAEAVDRHRVRVRGEHGPLGRGGQRGRDDSLAWPTGNPGAGVYPGL